MCESDTTHIHSNLKECPVCREEIKQWYRKDRTIKSLSVPIYLVSHIYTCENEECPNYHKRILPEEETLLAIQGYQYGLDVILKIGRLRFISHRTWQEIQKILEQENRLKISEREIGYLEEAYLALTNIVAKEDRELLAKLDELIGLIIAIDGIKPDSSNDVLYLIREVQTGRVVAARVISQNVRVNLEELLQEVIDLGYPILGVISDKEPSILSAVKAKLPEIPHQLCHYHYLKNLALPMVEADSKLKKKVTFWLRSKITKFERELRAYSLIIGEVDGELLREALGTMPGAGVVSEHDIQVILDYCLAIKTLFKRKSVYPLKPGGLRLYQNLLEIKESLLNWSRYNGNFFIERLLAILSNVLNDEELKKYVNYLGISYRWIHRIASSISKPLRSEEEAKQKLVSLIESFDHQNDANLSEWLDEVKKMSYEWLSGLFKYLSQPLLPKTNNDLETFNGRVKKTHRKITGRKNSQNFVARFGLPVSILLGMPKDLDLRLKFSVIPYPRFRQEREQLTQKGLRSKIYRIRRSLSDYLFDLEIQWSQWENN